MAALETTSWRLIRQAATGDPTDRDEFARRYLPAVRAFFVARWRRTPLAKDVEDAVQEVFVECFRPGGALPKADAARPGGFRPFFFGVLRNVALRWEQRAGRQSERGGAGSPALEEIRDGSASQSQVLDRQWAREIMRAAAARQLEVAQGKGEAAVRRVELLRMRFQEQQPIREIARVWQVDAAFLHHEYTTARVEFEAALREVVAGCAADGEVDDILRRLLAALG